jgi:hypothetical protein
MAVLRPVVDSGAPDISRTSRFGRDQRARAVLRIALVASAALAVAGAVLSTQARGALWLDEAQSVAIARLPLGDLFRALREDGAPPLYYLVLHGWIAVFGESTASVRALSTVFALGSLPVMWYVARRIGGRSNAFLATVLLATSPFMIRYATETRMYTMLVFLVLLGTVAVLGAAARPTLPRLALVALASGALLLTHYWSLYLLAVLVAVLVNEAARRGRDVAWRLAAAVVAGGVLFLPWVPAFVFQMRHTGAPWAGRPSIGDLLNVMTAYAAPFGLDSWGWLLWLSLLGLFGLGVFARRRRSGTIELHTHPRFPQRQLATVVAGTLAVALLVGLVANSPVTARYTAVVFPVILLVVARGLRVFSRTTACVLLVVMALAGVVGGRDAAIAQRTEVPRVAITLEQRALPGDLVVYCPDQLGPSTSRLFDRGIQQVTFPSLRDPARVDWVDYLDRFDAADVEQFARTVNAMAGTGYLWFVTAPNYMTTSDTCSALRDQLERLRPSSEEVVSADGRFFEQAQLYQMPPATTGL